MLFQRTERQLQSTLLVAAAATMGLVGCELGQNLTDIADVLGKPEMETLDGEGDRLATGRFRALRFDGNGADGVFVVAIKTTDEEEPRSLLALIPFPAADGPCDAGPAGRYAQAVSRPGRSDKAGEARIPFLVPSTEDKPQALRFSNFKCELDDVTIEGGGIPIDSGFAADPGFIVQTEESALYWVSPWQEKKILITDSARTVSRDQRALFAAGHDGEQWMWTIEKGEIVVRDRSFAELARFGQDVDDLVHGADDDGRAMIAYHQESGEVRVAYASDLTSSARIESDACRVSFSSGNDGTRLLYYSPCEERNVVAYDLATEKRNVLAEGVANYRIIGERTDGTVTMYITNDDGNSSVGTLWARFGAEQPVRIGVNGHLGLTRLNTSGEIKAILDWGEHGGTLSVGQAGVELEELLSDVVYYGSSGVIADWDGEAGTLYNLTSELTVERVLKDVTTRGLKYDSPTKRSLVLMNFDGDKGDLMLVRQNDQKEEPILMSKDVQADSYQFTVQLPTVTILSGLDAETGTATLKLRKLDGSGETIVADGVSEALEVSWPKAGMLYSIPVGERAGIWFSEAR